MQKNIHSANRKSLKKLLHEEECGVLISQIAMSKKGTGGRRTLPYVFTEHGVAVPSSVLNSEKAIQINIQIMNPFVQMHRLAVEHKDLQEQINELKQYFFNMQKLLSILNMTMSLLLSAQTKIMQQFINSVGKPAKIRK